MSITLGCALPANWQNVSDDRYRSRGAITRVCGIKHRADIVNAYKVDGRTLEIYKQIILLRSVRDIETRTLIYILR